MLLAIDVGNTHTLLALCERDAILHRWRIATNPTRTEDELAILLDGLLQSAELARSAIHDVIIACVVPDALFALELFAKQLCDATQPPIIVGKTPLPPLMPIQIDHPEELGADRLVNAYAAWVQHRCGLIVIDFGTATTFDVVSENGAYLGGAIAPGVQLSLSALTRGAAKLHGIAIARPAQAVGTNTTHAMQSGIYYGYLGMVNQLIAQIQADVPQAQRVIATGGLAGLFAADNPAIHQHAPDLTLQGLMLIAQQHRKETHGL
jgi:type III pantothenate kinase